MADIPDGYDAYYAGKLWSLLPEIYRTLDATNVFDPNAASQPSGPLREIVNRIGKQAATLRRSIDRMWEDQSIETCDDWVIPYIGAQIAANLVSSLDARAQRLEVAQTISERQRKGTIPVLESVAVRVTGWDARVTELFRRMGRARHGLDPPFGNRRLAVASGLTGRVTGTAAGGYANLRNDYGASRSGTAFNELFHTADLRSLPGRTTYYNIPNAGIFLWRLRSVMVSGVTPVATQSGGEYTFDPTGREVPLFAAPVTVNEINWTARPEQNLPAPIDRRLLRHALTDLYANIATDQSLVPNAVGLFRGPPSAATLVPRSEIGACPGSAGHYAIDPGRGRFTVPAGGGTGSLQTSYYTGVASFIGAGGYDRRTAGQPTQPPASHTVSGGGGNMISAASGSIEIEDSLTYAGAPDCAVDGTQGGLVLRAANLQRPLLRFPPHPQEPARWTFTGTAGSSLTLDGLFVSGGDVVLAGTFGAVTLTSCTLDPGSWENGSLRHGIDGRALHASRLLLAGAIGKLTIDRCILGPLVAEGPGSAETVCISDSVVQASRRDHRTSIPSGQTIIRSSTVLGPAALRWLEASDCIFAGKVNVADIQTGCLRYSAWAAGSSLPEQYRCVEVQPGQALFASTDFGQPDFARLSAQTDATITAGAANGSEMGVFAGEGGPLKERSLLIKYREIMPAGLAPALIYMT